ncbi:hypothetical protein PM082_010598 [Marasmius tenuissimus]|nr:hypothetical protein PM082_010598 [Marasmius tenuissimus]
MNQFCRAWWDHVESFGLQEITWTGIEWNEVRTSTNQWEESLRQRHGCQNNSHKWNFATYLRALAQPPPYCEMYSIKSQLLTRPALPHCFPQEAIRLTGLEAISSYITHS